MLKPSRFSFALSLAVTAAALWLWHADAALQPEPFERGQLLVVNCGVFNPATERVDAGRDVLIEDGVITAIAPSGSLKFKKDPPRVQGEKRTLMPGLIDLAVFASLDGSLPDDRKSTNIKNTLRVQLAAGVTTLFDLNASRGQINDPELTSSPLSLPRLRFGASALSARAGWRPSNPGDGASPFVEVGDSDELEQAFKALRADGATLAFASVEHEVNDDAALDAALLTRLGELCAAASLPLVIHVEHPSKAIAALQAHPVLLIGSWGSERVTPELCAAMRTAGVAWAPALQALMGFQPPHDLVPGLRSMSQAEWLSASLVDSLGNWEELLSYARRFTASHAQSIIAAENLGAMNAAGVSIVLGSFSGMPGLPHGAAIRIELGRMVDSGMTPSRALRCATLDAATALKRPELGRVSVGAKADLLLLDGDPSKDLAALRRISAVIRGGKLWTTRELAEP